ncbi:MAG: hypothetical protein GY816_19030 [Cytophagales bacterium]|nr:hypothetical protein [Cytophagales bacterium]
MFQTLIHFLAYGAIIFSLIEVYLMLNKLWSRKHIKEVTDSISISARVMGIVPATIFTVNYFFEEQWQGVIDGMIWIFAAIMQIVVAAGLWVVGNKNRDIFDLIRRSIKDESKELNNLAKFIFQVSSREKIIDLLAAMALTDKILNDEEKKFVENLASNWEIKVSWDKLIGRFKKKDISALINLSIEMRKYMELHPTKKEFKLLLKCMRQLSDQSGYSRPENQYIIDEFVESYAVHTERIQPDRYQVQVVPQEKEQHEKMHASGVSMTSAYIGSGFTYVFGPIYTQNFAEKVTVEFEELGYFATVKRFSAEPNKEQIEDE